MSDLIGRELAVKLENLVAVVVNSLGSRRDGLPDFGPQKRHFIYLVVNTHTIVVYYSCFQGA